MEKPALWNLRFIAFRLFTVPFLNALMLQAHMDMILEKMFEYFIKSGARRSKWNAWKIYIKHKACTQDFSEGTAIDQISCLTK